MSQRGEPEDHDYTGSDRDSGLRPSELPPIQQPDHETNQADDDEFQVIETDEGGKPLGGDEPPPRQQQRQEGRLSEGEAGERSYVEQQRQQDEQLWVKEPKRARNARRAHAREKEARENTQLRGEIGELREQLVGMQKLFTGQVEPRIVELGEQQIQQNIRTIDQEVANAEAAYNAANSRFVTAGQASDTEGQMSALNDRDKALVRRERASTAKANAETQLARLTEQRGRAPDQQQRRQEGVDPRQQQQAPRLSARAQANVDRFQDENSWFDPNGRDMDSRIAMMVDKDIMDRGFRPEDPAYWEEMDAMLQERLPHLYRDAPAPQQQDGQPPPRQQQPRQQQPRPGAAPQQRRGPPSFGPGDRSPSARNSKTVYVSPQRKEAMIMSGSIDSRGQVLDQKKYKSQLAQYAAYDRTSAADQS